MSQTWYKQWDKKEILLPQARVTRRKVTIYHDCHFWSLLKTPPSTTILVGFVVNLKTFFLVLEVLYCHGLGQIMVDGRPAYGRCRFSILRPILESIDLFRLWGRDVCVSSGLFSFLRASSHWSMQQSMIWTMDPRCQPLRLIICSTWLLATCFYFFETARIDNAHGCY
jgi:hypothetical protein